MGKIIKNSALALAVVMLLGGVYAHSNSASALVVPFVKCIGKSCA